MTTGEQLKAARKGTGLTQKQLAEKAGLSIVTIRRCEQGRYAPNTKTCIKIADALGCNPWELILEQADESDKPDEKFVLTKWGCLKAVLTDYGIDADRIPGRVGEHIVDDFMQMMCKQGYVERQEGAE